MKNPLLDAVQLEPGRPARAAVIWLHGLGADGHDFVPIVPLLGLGPEPPVRFVFPHAPSIPVTINGRAVMPAWYDIRSLEEEDRADEAGVRASAARVERLIDREVERGIDRSRIVLAGFSQGGAIALHVGLRSAGPLLGLIALSTYMVCPATIEAEATVAGRALPVFAAHGLHDPLVSLSWGEAARDRLRSLGLAVEWSTWPMGHEVCPEEIRRLGDWLRSRLDGVGAAS